MFKDSLFSGPSGFSVPAPARVWGPAASAGPPGTQWARLAGYMSWRPRSRHCDWPRTCWWGVSSLLAGSGRAAGSWPPGCCGPGLHHSSQRPSLSPSCWSTCRKSGAGREMKPVLHSVDPDVVVQLPGQPVAELWTLVSSQPSWRRR